MIWNGTLPMTRCRSSGNGTRSASPSTTSMRGFRAKRRRSPPASPGSSSIATTRSAASASGAVSRPVPAPISTTRSDRAIPAAATTSAARRELRRRCCPSASRARWPRPRAATERHCAGSHRRECTTRLPAPAGLWSLRSLGRGRRAGRSGGRPRRGSGAGGRRRGSRRAPPGSPSSASATPSPASISRFPAYAGCRTAAYGPARTTSWSCATWMSRRKNRPSATIAHARSPIPAHMIAMPISVGAQPVIGNSSPGSCTAASRPSPIPAVTLPTSIYFVFRSSSRRSPVRKSVTSRSVRPATAARRPRLRLSSRALAQRHRPLDEHGPRERHGEESACRVVSLDEELHRPSV